MLAATPEGALVAWRAAGARPSVWATALALGADGALARRGEEREIAGPARAFDITSAPGGAALAVIERTARGDEVVLARLDEEGLARNVPRVVGRVRDPDGLSIVWNELGYVVAWGARGSGGDAQDTPESLEPRGSATYEAARAGTWVVVTDARGVPRARVRRVRPGRAPVLAFSPGGASLALTVRGEETALLLLDEGAHVRDEYRWSPLAQGLAALPSGPTFFSALATEGGTLVVARGGTGVGSSEQAALYRGPVASVRSVAADRGGVVLVLGESEGRESLVRVGSDGVVQQLATRAGTRGAAVSSGEGAFFWAGFDATNRVRVTHVSCPRPAPYAPPLPAINTPGPTATLTDAQVDRDAGARDASAGADANSGASAE